MLFTHQDVEGVRVITVEKARIDASCAPEFAEDAKHVLSRCSGPCIVDLGRVNFMDSTGIGSLVGLLKFMAGKRDLVLCGLRPAIHKIMKLTRLDTVFLIDDSVHTALARLAPRDQAAG